MSLRRAMVMCVLMFLPDETCGMYVAFGSLCNISGDI